MKRGRQIESGWTEIRDLDEKDYLAVQNDLTVRASDGGTVYAFDEDDDGTLFVPRYYARHRFPDDLYGKNEDRRSRGVPMCGKWTGTLRMNQVPLVEKALHRLEFTHGGQIILACGAGKTICALYLASHVLGRRTAVVVEKELLLNQWVEAVNKVTDCSVGVVQGDRRELDRDFVIMMAQTLRVRPLSDHEQHFFGVLIVDELHHFSAPSLHTCIPQLSAFWRLGLTATDTRSDGLSSIFEWHIGPVLVRQNEWDLPPVIYRVNTGISIDGFIPNEALSTILNAQAECEARDAVILSAIRRSADAARWPLVLSDRIDQLVRLQSKLDGVDSGLLIGTGKHRTKKDDRVQEIAKRVLFATYGSGGEGFDDEKRDTLISATTRQNMIQPLGRITRDVPGKKTPIALDLVDTGVYWEQKWRARKRKYERMGWMIERGRV